MADTEDGPEKEEEEEDMARSNLRLDNVIIPPRSL